MSLLGTTLRRDIIRNKTDLLMAIGDLLDRFQVPDMTTLAELLDAGFCILAASQVSEEIHQDFQMIRDRAIQTMKDLVQNEIKERIYNDGTENTPEASTDSAENAEDTSEESEASTKEKEVG